MTIMIDIADQAPKLTLIYSIEEIKLKKNREKTSTFEATRLLIYKPLEINFRFCISGV